MLLKRRLLHCYYVVSTAETDPVQYEMLTNGLSRVRGSIFRKASSPWARDNVLLKADLTQVVRLWPTLVKSSSESDVVTISTCPIDLSGETDERLNLNLAQLEADEQADMCAEIVGVG